MTSASSILRLALTLVGVATLPGGVEGPAPRPRGEDVRAGARRALALVGRDGVLASGYRLPLVAIPDPPPGLGADVASAAVEAEDGASDGCPLALRAVVEGEAAGDTFAMMEVGGEARVVHVGQELHVREARYSVARIEASAVWLRRGDSLVRCGLP